MAHLIEFERNERVYEKCNERGCEFYDWVQKLVKHRVCSECKGEVSVRNTKFCPNCGVKLSGYVAEQKQEKKCVICGNKYKVSCADNYTKCCKKCEGVIRNSDRVEAAKYFYGLGRESINKK